MHTREESRLRMWIYYIVWRNTCIHLFIYKERTIQEERGNINLWRNAPAKCGLTMHAREECRLPLWGRALVLLRKKNKNKYFLAWANPPTLRSAWQLLISRYGYIRFAHVHERVWTESIFVYIMGNSKSNHLGVQGTLYPTWCSALTLNTFFAWALHSKAVRWYSPAQNRIIQKRAGFLR